MLNIAISNLWRGIFSVFNNGENIVWNTPAGDLGTFWETDIVDIQLDVLSKWPIDFYEIVDGEFPDFLSLLNNGKIYGQVPEDIGENFSTTFTVRVVDEREGFADQTFTLNFRLLVSLVEWITPEGQLEALDLGQPFLKTLKAESTLQ